jgi:hypothetical protein
MKKYPKSIPHFLGVGDDFSYENNLNQPKKLYQNVHNINIEVLEKKPNTYKNISPTFKYLNFIFQTATNFRSNSSTCK